jgi:hypothetical protein
MRKLTWTPGVAACVFSLVACGSSSRSLRAAATSDAGLQLARCMRANGVSNFPDPSGPAGTNFEFKAQVNPQVPGVKAALQACRRYLPNKPLPGAMSAGQRERAVAFARCMRVHGQNDFPDPSVGPASPTVTGRVLALQGMFFEVGPGLDPTAPAFRQAAGDCGVRLPPLGDRAAAIG